jgi:hypothetical protein
MSQNNNVLMVLGLFAVIALIVYICNVNKDKGEKYTRNPEIQEPDVVSIKNIEKFTGLAAGASNNAGIFFDDTYDLLPGADNGIPARHFADMVNKGEERREYVKQPKDLTESMRPSERLNKIQGASMMPRTSTYVTPYNVDVALPSSGNHSYMVGAHKVQTALKSKFKDYSLSGFIRGSVPITMHPNVCLVAKTYQGRDDLRLDGLMTPYNNALYNKYTGKAYKNLVQHVAGAGSAEGYGGSSGGTLMDGY